MVSVSFCPRSCARARTQVRAAIATLDDREAQAPTVKAACEALGAQLKNDVEMLVPSHPSLLAALCTRLNLVLVRTQGLKPRNSAVL